ncbi:MAG TPA: hypothetical protein VF131_24990 [Blastocatellia bacterium]|nr:hypothetical protein [Blastocatellia bacterium]
MKVKIFVGSVTVMQGSNDTALEDEINGWLTDNPNVEIVDIRISADAQSSEVSGKNFQALCLVLYKGKIAKKQKPLGPVE